MENFSIQNIELCYYFFFNIICPLNKRDFKKGIILVFKSFFLLLIYFGGAIMGAKYRFALQ